jgi:hypothetical protein
LLSPPIRVRFARVLLLDVSEIDLRTGQVRRRIPVGESPWGLAFSKGR